LERIAPEMTSLFPLAACTGIEYRDRLLRVRFDDDQTISVPKAYGQADLALSREIAFAVEKLADAPPGSLSFALREGSLRVEFSFLAKLFGPPYVRDFPIGRLDYRLDEEKRSACMIAGNAGAEHRRDELALRRDGDELTVDLRDDGHPRDRDIVITRDGIDFRCLGWDARLGEGDEVMMDGEKRVNAALHAGLAELVRKAFADPEALFADGFRLDENYRYDLEARSLVGMSSTWAFGPAAK
jgi:hypothetical protein